MKTKNIWLVLTLLIVTTPLLFSYEQAAPKALVQNTEAAVQDTVALSSALIPTTLATGETIFVSSTDDSGPGTLRQALENAQSGDTIIFDPVIFPPSASATIYLRSQLPGIG